MLEISDISEKVIRRDKAAYMTWDVINLYIKHNYLEEWIPKMSKYFNKFTKIGHLSIMRFLLVLVDTVEYFPSDLFFTPRYPYHNFKKV